MATTVRPPKKPRSVNGSCKTKSVCLCRSIAIPQIKSNSIAFRGNARKGHVLTIRRSIGISLTTLSMLLAVHHLYPSLRPYTTPFFELSYYQPSQGVYVQGWNDVYFVASAAIAFTAIRAITIDWILRPVASRCGLKRKTSVRFAEQGWQWLYYAFFWTFGMVRRPRLVSSHVCYMRSANSSAFSSISGPTPPIGWISAPSGRNGLRAACPGP